MNRWALLPVMLLVLVFAGTASAQIDTDDLHRSGVAGAGRLSPQAVLERIEALLDEIYGEMGRRYEKEVRKNSDEDTIWKGKFDAWNLQLKSLWKQFDEVLNGDVESRRMDRDQAFAGAMNEAFMRYRNAFGAKEGDPNRAYADMVTKSQLKRYVLREDIPFFSGRGWYRLGIDKKIKLSKGVKGLSSWSDPTKWGNDDVAYAVGLLPSELLRDVNKSIQASYYYGYLYEWNRLGSGRKTVGSAYGWNDYSHLSWDYTWDDEVFYYQYIYDSQYLYGSLDNQFRATQPSSGSSTSNVEAMERAMAKAEEALKEAEDFKNAHTEVTLHKSGEMYLARGVDQATIKTLWAEYQAIADRFKTAMNEYKTYLDDYRSNFPGAETGVLHKGMNDAFQAYRTNFVYNELDGYMSRYDVLKRRSEQFKLKRTGFAAIDKDLYKPGWWRRPRKELYSAQRVLTLLPADMKNAIDGRRQWAYTRGRWAAEAEYKDANNYSYGSTYDQGSYSYDTEPGHTGNSSNGLPGEDLPGSYDTQGGSYDTQGGSYDTQGGSYDTQGGSYDTEGGLPGEDF